MLEQTDMPGMDRIEPSAHRDHYFPRFFISDDGHFKK